MFGWGVMAYFGLGLAAVVAAEVWLGVSLFTLENPWLTLGGVTRAAYSVLLGTTLGTLVVATSRQSVEHFAWAKRLQEDFRPVARELTAAQITTLALCSGIAEELVFRGLLQQWLGLWPQAVLFGLVHQMRGPSRWVWVIWAAVVGLALGALFQLTGSLIGPLVAHVLINQRNLSHLKHQHAPPPEDALGGLLKRSRF